MQQPATVVVSQEPTLTVVQPVAPQTPDLKKSIRNLGIWQIVFGVAALIIGIVIQVKLHFWARLYAPGISSGIWVLIGGILCLSSSFHLTNKCLVAANMTFAIISFFCALGECIIAGFAIYFYRTHYSICGIIGSGYTYRFVCFEFPNAKLGLAMYSVLFAVMFLEVTTSLTTVINCGKACCCGTPVTTGGVFLQQQQPYFVQSSMVTSEPPPSYVTTSKSHSSAVIDMNPIHKSGNAGIESGGIFNSGFGADLGSGSGDACGGGSFGGGGDCGGGGGSCGDGGFGDGGCGDGD